jgi:RimJ/RimL family protein N-acetyltransferase
MAKIEAVKRITKSGLNITLRTPMPGEGKELLEAMTEVIRESDHLLTTPEEFKYTVEQEEGLIRDHLENADKLLIVPELEGKIAGMLSFSAGHRRRIAHQGELGVSLRANCRGQGVGRFLVEELLKWAKNNPRLETVRLRVHAKNIDAVALYKKMGFREEGRELKGAKFGPGQYDDVILMAVDV